VPAAFQNVASMGGMLVYQFLAGRTSSILAVRNRRAVASFFAARMWRSGPNELRRKPGYLSQDFGVYDNLTATEFLTSFAAPKGVCSKEHVMEMLESVT
jgi:ABC-type multidrug transport system ATPase subunit